MDIATPSVCLVSAPVPAVLPKLKRSPKLPPVPDDMADTIPPIFVSPPIRILDTVVTVRDALVVIPQRT